MRRPDHTLQAWRLRALLGLWLFLYLLLVGGTAQASTVTRREAMPMAVAAMSQDSMPMVMSCAPCARCYVAPVPVTQGFSGEGKEVEALHRQAHAIAQTAIVWVFDTGVLHPRLPVRIEFSRWLN